MATGGAAFIMLTMAGAPVPLAMLGAFLAGVLAGLVTGLFHTACGIPAILAGILTQLALYSVNLRIMGQANRPVKMCIRDSHRVLKHPTDEFGPLVLRQAGHVHPVDDDGAAVHRKGAGHRIEHGGLAGAIAADDRAEVTVLQRQADAPEGLLFIDRPGVEQMCIRDRHYTKRRRKCQP